MSPNYHRKVEPNLSTQKIKIRHLCLGVLGKDQRLSTLAYNETEPKSDIQCLVTYSVTVSC